MRKAITVSFLAAFAAVGFSSTQLMAAFIPPPLPPGSQYQLVFATSQQTKATNLDINYYNTLVHIAATGNPDLPATSWRAIVSTPTVNAMTNAPWAGVPVYNTQGILMTDTRGLYHPASDSVGPIEYNQFGVLYTGPVWTGTHNGGYTFWPLGDPGGLAITGTAGLKWQWLGNSLDIVETLHPIYALSGPITVPVPEPGGLALLGSALLFFAFGLNRKRNRG